MSYTPYNKEIITVSSAVVSQLDATILGSGAVYVIITVELFPVRFWVSGATPTATQGHELMVGDVLTLDQLSELSTFRAINLNTDGSHNAKLVATYYT